MNDIKKICNATNLKYLAVALMFLDQIYQMFGSMGAPIWLTMLGRLSFPIFLFLAADSFHYTHDRMAFLRRLLYMSWFMIIGNAIIGSIFHNGRIGLTNNAFSTFFITGIFICSWDLLANGLRDKSNKELIQGIGVFLLPILSSIPVVILAGIFETPHANPIVVQICCLYLVTSAKYYHGRGWLCHGYSWVAILYFPYQSHCSNHCLSCYFSDCPSL